MEEDSEESMMFGLDPSQEEPDSSQVPSFLTRVSPNSQDRQRSRLLEMASILGRMPAASRNRLLRRNEEDKSSDEDTQAHSQIGVRPEWYALIPESHEEFVRELIEQFGPVILYIYGKAIHIKLIDNFSSPADVINKFLNKVLSSCTKFLTTQSDLTIIMDVVSCLPKFSILNEHVNLYVKGLLNSKVDNLLVFYVATIDN